MLVISSTVYNEIPSEPTIIVVPIFDHDPDTGLGVPLDDGAWAAPGLATGYAIRASPASTVSRQQAKFSIALPHSPSKARFCTGGLAMPCIQHVPWS